MTHRGSDLRIVLLGKSGSGKSATGNTILGRKAFEVVDFMKSANQLCEKKEGVVGEKTVSIIDTPGLFNTAMDKQQVKAEIEKSIEMSSPGPHVFLLVLKLGVRFTKEERDTVKWIQENFGEEALHRTIILFTHADLLKGKPLDEYIDKSKYLMEIVHSCDSRYHSFNNEDRNNQDQVTELLKKIDAMIEENVSHYTLEMYKTTQKKKKRKNAEIACAVAVIGIVFLGKRKIPGMIVAAISGRATAESAVVSTGECAEKAVEVFLKTLAAAGEEGAKKASAAIEKAVAAAGEAATKKASAAIEKAGDAAAKKAVEAIEKAIADAAETAVEKTVAETTRAGVATQGAVCVAVTMAAAAAARSATAAGKVVTSGRISVLAALAAAFGATAVTLISALK